MHALSNVLETASETEERQQRCSWGIRSRENRGADGYCSLLAELRIHFGIEESLEYMPTSSSMRVLLSRRDFTVA
jgi:hypothetical protein